MLVCELRGDRVSAPKKGTGSHHNDLAFLEPFLDLDAVAREEARLDGPFPHLIACDREHGRAVILIENGGRRHANGVALAGVDHRLGEHAEAQIRGIAEKNADAAKPAGRVDFLGDEF